MKFFLLKSKLNIHLEIMLYIMKQISFLRVVIVFFLLLSGVLYGQKTKLLTLNILEATQNEVVELGASQIVANDYKVYKFDISALTGDLNGIASVTDPSIGYTGRISLPHPDGTVKKYDVKRNTTISPALNIKHPDIYTMDGYGVDHSAKMKWSITSKGLHAMIMQPNKPTIFIDPYNDGNSNYYIVYLKKDFYTDKVKDCLFESNSSGKPIQSSTSQVKSYTTCELRTYRLALAATVEYTDFHGGTVADAQAAQAVTMNRVNGIYERDLALTMEIIPNNDLIVYEGDPNLDPYTNGDPGAMITENQANLDNVIGSANYDIGHVFGTNSGGLAGLGVVCSNGVKAYGVTGSAAPIGDPFDVDYVAHEIGHQFGANHTQNNNCNRNNATAMEPGSASTILGYAGICNPNVQNNSDDHFHGISLEEMGNYIATTSCAVTTAIPNNAPTITGTNANVVVPAGTPFSLTAFATDPDGDILSYCWEQMDNEISNQPPESTATDGPNFRSNSPVNDPTRYFPNLIDLANGGPYTWEVVPTVSRTMNFRVSVRDQPLGVAGCTDFSDVTISTDASAGPFIVQYPSATGIVWDALTQETVLWDVANTDLAPISCSEVDIFLSVDGGQSYPTVLATNVPNTGSAVINVPNVSTTTARVMVVSAAGTFFDISDNNFEIVESTFDFTLDVNPKELTVCQPNDAVYTVDIGEVGGFSDPVSLSVAGVPAGATANFSVDPVTPVGSSDLTISNTASAAPGTYTLTISGTSTTGTKTEDVTLTISNGNPTPVTLETPLDAETEVNVPTNFTWSAAPETGVTYEIQIASDQNFGTIVDQATGLNNENFTSNVLAPGEQYYWRVRYNAFCGQSDWSDVFTFVTSNCTVYQSTDVPVTIPNAGTVTSLINVSTSASISSVKVTELQGIHGRIPHLTFTLTSPTGTTIVLMDQVCNNNNEDFDIAFDDDAASAIIPCPPTDGNAYQPEGLLADFIGEDQIGDWVLTITDNQNPIGGELQAWAIEICTTSPTTCNEPDVPTITEDATICEGQSLNLSILNGDLNDASDWEWYTGSCGGVNIGTGSVITVSPTVTTTYFARGEGGCVTPGACAEITITVNPTYNETDAVTICDGDTYVFGTQSLTTVGTYSEVFTTVDGCDSTVVLTLDVNPTYNETDAATICTGQTYTFGTQALTTGGTYTEIFATVDGCDSTVVLTLSEVSGFNETDEASICDGDSYVFGTQTLTTSGSYTEQFTSSSGCDSTVTLTLDVNLTYNETDALTICDGDTYVFGTQSLTTAGTYSEVFTTVDGCDSTVVLTLDVNPTFSSTEVATICQGSAYVFPDGNVGNTTQSYSSQLTASNGCDSIVVTNLTVIDLDPTVTENAGTLTASQPDAYYQWVDCDNNNTAINGATNQSFSPETPGNFAVVISLEPCSITSECTQLDDVGIKDVDGLSVLIYPNPTNNTVNIEWDSTIKEIEMMDAVGKKVMYLKNINSEKTIIDMSSLESGVYLFRIKGEYRESIHEIVKQ